MLDRRFNTFPEFRDACLAEGVFPALVMADRFHLHGHLLPDMVADGYDINGPLIWPRIGIHTPPGWSGYNMLQKACLFGDVSDIRAIVACGASVDVKTRDGQTIVVLSLNNHKVLRYVISLQPRGSYKALCVAIENANVEAVRIFIDSGLDISCQLTKSAIVPADTCDFVFRDRYARMCRYIAARGGRVCEDCVLNDEVDTKAQDTSVILKDWTWSRVAVIRHWPCSGLLASVARYMATDATHCAWLPGRCG